MSRYGLLSGKYDSTRQRAVLLTGNRLRNYRSYSLTMRMEMLLTGRLVLTEPMFFDGLYFHWVSGLEGELDALKDIAVAWENVNSNYADRKLLAVKCKPKFQSQDICTKDSHNGDKVLKTVNMDSVASRMYSKQFLFSSIPESALQDFIYELSSDFEENYQLSKEDTPITFFRKRFENYNEFKKFYENQLMCIPNDDYLKDLWIEYTKALDKMKEFPLDIWGYFDDTNTYNFSYEMGRFLDEHIYRRFKDLKCDSEEKDSLIFSYRERLLALASAVEAEIEHPLAHRYICRMKDQIKFDFSTRSKFVVSITELRKINESRRNPFNIKENKSIEKLTKYFDEMDQILNDRTNKVYAVQHGCQFIDICDYNELLKTKEISFQFEKLDTKPNMFNKLAEMSWNDFKDFIYNTSDLLDEMYKWLCIYNNQNDEDITKGCLQKYLNILANSIEDFHIKSQPIVDGPWNYKNTCDNNLNILNMINDQHSLNKSIYYFVGGGSFTKGKEGNEICILHRNEKTVFRIRLNNDDPGDDEELDTLIAPVENKYNGRKETNKS